MSSDSDFNHFPQIAEALPKWLDSIIEETAKDVVKRAVDNAPDDTGFLESSIYYSASNGVSTYGEGIKTPPEDASVLPEEKPSSGEHEAIVGVAASYGLYQEYGTAHDAAHPYLIPAADAATPDLMALAETLEDALSGVQ